MTRANRKRLAAVSHSIETMPIAPAVLESAYERFRETGELPEHQRVAHEVVLRAVDGGRGIRVATHEEAMASIKRMMALAKGEEVEPEPEPYRDILFNEAVNGPSFVRPLATLALKILVDLGRDVTDPEFIPYDTDIPDWGSVAWHLIGFPERLAKPPYEEQAQRLLARFDDLRARIDRDDKGWFERLAEAGCKFMHEGELPDDELLRETVLANGEFFELCRCFVGQGVPEVMAAFDRLAVDELQAMAIEGRLVSCLI